MATELTPVSIPGKYPSTPLAALAAEFTPVATDLAGNTFKNTGKEIIVLQNTDVGAVTVTITSQPDEKNRLGTITAYSLPASGFAGFGPFPTLGWNDAAGLLLFTSSDVDLLAAVLRFTL